MTGDTSQPHRGTGRLAVLLVTPLFPPDVGGAARYASVLASRMSGDPRIVRVAVLTAGAREAPYVERSGSCMVYRAFPRALRANEPAWFKASRRLQTALVLYVFLIASAVFRRYDVVHLHGNFCRIVGRMRNYPLEGIIAAFRLPCVLDLRDPAAWPVTSRAYNRIICASLAIWNRAAAANKARPYYIPTPIEAGRIRRVAFETPSPLEEDAAPFVCYVGEISARKGLPELLEGFRWYLADSPGRLRLILVGPLAGITRETLTRSPQVVYLGEQPWEECLAVMSRAEAVVCPSHSEGLPRVCLEALALGKRVLLPPGIEEFRRLCPDWVLGRISAEEIRVKLKVILATPPRVFDMMRFDMDVAWPEYLSVYRSLRPDPHGA